MLAVQLVSRVLISNNLMHNMGLIESAIHLVLLVGSHYHDMGLITGLLQPYLNASSILLPSDFVRKPIYG